MPLILRISWWEILTRELFQTTSRALHRFITFVKDIFLKYILCFLLAHRQTQSHTQENLAQVEIHSHISSTCTVCDRTQQENKELREQIDYYEKLLGKKCFSHKGRSFMLILEETRSQCTDPIAIDDENAENIRQHFYEHFNELHIKLPRKLQQNNFDWWPTYCKLFQTSFQCCRDAFINTLVEPLYSLTELSEEENVSSQTNWDRESELENVVTAYSCLLRHSISNLRRVDQSVVEKVLATVPSDCLLSQEHVLQAVEICWRMLMLPTPMFVCQPKLLNEDWHEIHRSSWHKRHNELVYYRPVLMNSIEGIPAYRGLVGNVADKNFPESESFENPGTVSPTKETERGNSSNAGGNILSESSTEEDWQLSCLLIYRCCKCQLTISRQELHSCHKESGFYYHKKCYKCF